MSRTFPVLVTTALALACASAASARSPSAQMHANPSVVMAGKSFIVTGNPILDAVNAQRSASGIPPVTWNADWAGKCHEFNEYAIANNGWDADNPHGETVGKPGYSDDGNWAGGTSVLSRAVTFAATPFGATPWENAPIHLGQVLAPSITQMGGDVSGSYTCLTTWAGFTAPTSTDSPTFYSYPGNGTTGIEAREQAAEWPTTPEKELGLGDNPITGPNLFVYAEGFDNQTVVQSASMTGPDGAPVDLAWWDANLWQLRGYNEQGSVMLIPKQELIGNSRYSVSVTVGDPRAEQDTFRFNRTTQKLDKIVLRAAHTDHASYAFSFTTGPCPECLHLPGQPAGLFALKAGPARDTLIASSNGQSTPTFTVKVRRHGVQISGACLTGLSAKKTRGHRSCTVWAVLGGFKLAAPLGDGDTTITLAQLLRRTPPAGSYKVSVTIDGQTTTVELH